MATSYTRETKKLLARTIALTSAIEEATREMLEPPGPVQFRQAEFANGMLWARYGKLMMSLEPVFMSMEGCPDEALSFDTAALRAALRRLNEALGSLRVSYERLVGGSSRLTMSLVMAPQVRLVAPPGVVS